jgi:hypothetical protein
MVQSHSVALDLEQWKLYKTDNHCLFCKVFTNIVFQTQKEEPAVVALQVGVHESTSKLTSATGVMVHLFGSDIKVVMISLIISVRK